ncbi:MAG: hypothetical protein ACOWWR_06470 [Eubacteriales bacterium]
MCQLRYVDEIGKKNCWYNDKLQYVVRRFKYYSRVLRRLFINPQKACENLSQGYGELKPGELVKVRSIDDIETTLDKFRKTGGCTFQLKMYDHCDKEYKILKKVDYFFDEYKQKMCKCKDIYILEGCYCEGKAAFLRPCSRNCFYFWKINWLEKL